MVSVVSSRPLGTAGVRNSVAPQEAQSSAKERKAMVTNGEKTTRPGFLTGAGAKLGAERSRREIQAGGMGRRLHRRMSLCTLALLAAGMGPAAMQAAAEVYPSNVIRLVTGAPAGTSPDIIARIVANELSESEGWRIVVENKPGGIASPAAADVLKQPADGYSIVITALAHSAPALLPNIGYRLDTGFIPVIRLVTGHMVLVVNPSVPARSLRELVAVLKAQPNKLNFSSGGFGTPAHLAGEMLKLQTGVRVAHVSYRSPPHAIADLVNGTNHYQFAGPSAVVDLIAAGRLRALAVTGPNRIPALKDVPTVAEEGYPELVLEDWPGLIVKSGTPQHIVIRLNQAVNRALAKPHVREALARSRWSPPAALRLSSERSSHRRSHSGARS
jgi:tripartite-type tricarboxylate transporter receptor subunit TctC